MTSDARGNLIGLFAANRDGVLWVFDQRGGTIGKIGTVGNGEGQFVRPVLLERGQADSIHVYDYILKRHTVLTPGHAFVRAHEVLIRPAKFLPLSSGNLVINGKNGLSGTSRPIHILDEAGRIIHSFGPSGEAGWTRSLAEDTDGSLWSVRLTHRYELEHWSAHGQLLEILVPSQDWFRPYQIYYPPNGADQPSSAVLGTWLDRKNRHLWVLGAMHAPESKEQDENGIDRIMDGVIDVFDLPRRSLLVSMRTPNVLSLWVGGGRVAHFGKSPENDFLVDIMQVFISGAGPD
jgi:hypothetical protein